LLYDGNNQLPDNNLTLNFVLHNLKSGAVDKTQHGFDGERLLAIQWQKKYELGIDKIDKQHRILVEYTNRLEGILKNKSSPHLTDTLFRGLLRYTEYHFSWEETFMENINYPDIEVHRKLHQQFIDQIKKYKTNYDCGSDNCLWQLIIYLQYWLVEHIKEEDRMYTRQKGLVV